MPVSLFTDMERSGRDLRDTRAYELALELSMIRFGNENESFGTSFDCETRNKRSQNTTECVPVPSSEHVAEIVGRQGCKIKALRTKTNTYIKTPVRGEEPVFVVTGRREDVDAAKREILSAAEHFSQIRAQRKSNSNGFLVPGPNSVFPGQKTIQVRVPYRVVGLVVGPKGATIKRIQQLTNTYIVTPSRDKQPVFEVTGLPDNVENARKEIEAHIAVRTGNLVESDNDFDLSNFDSPLFTNNLNAVHCDLFKTNLGCELIHPFSYDSNNLVDLNNDSIFNLSVSNGNSKHSDLYSTIYANSVTDALSLHSADEGLNDPPIFDASGIVGSTTSTNSASLFKATTLKDTDTCPFPKSSIANEAFRDFILIDHSGCIRTDMSAIPFGKGILSRYESGKDLFPSLVNGFNKYNSIKSPLNETSGGIISPTESLILKRKCNRDCVMCHKSKVDSALVPCGHNLFCLECANNICEMSECPVCHQPASQAIRIYS